MGVKNIIIIIAVILLIGGGVLMFSNDGEEEILEKNGEEELKEIDEEATKEIKEILSRAEEIESLKYDIRIEIPEGVFTSKFWEKGEKMRLDMALQGREMINLWDREKEIGYLYTGGDIIATKINIEQAKDVFQGSIKEWTKDALYYESVVIGRESLNDKDCYIVSYTAEDGDVKMWVWKDYGLPIKIESYSYLRKTERVIDKIEIIDLPDNVFTLPPGIEITEEFLFF